MSQFKQLGEWSREDHFYTMTARYALKTDCSMEDAHKAEAMCWDMVSEHVAKHGPERVEDAFDVADFQAESVAAAAAGGLEGAALERFADVCRERFREGMEWREPQGLTDPEKEDAAMTNKPLDQIGKWTRAAWIEKMGRYEGDHGVSSDEGRPEAALAWGLASEYVQTRHGADQDRTLKAAMAFVASDGPSMAIAIGRSRAPS